MSLAAIAESLCHSWVLYVLWVFVTVGMLGYAGYMVYEARRRTQVVEERKAVVADKRKSTKRRRAIR